MINVLFVCLGNICRSPMAEAVFQDMVEKQGLKEKFNIESVGTSSYHVGDKAHPGTRRVLANHGIECHNIARQISRADMDSADYIVAMDRSNAADLQFRTKGTPAEHHIHLLLDFAPQVDFKDVPDPYYSGNFEEVFSLVEAGCRGLLDQIRRDNGI